MNIEPASCRFCAGETDTREIVYYIHEDDMSEIRADQVLDARGLNCPLPVLRTRKALEGIESGQVLKVVSTDAASRADMKALIERLGHELLDVREAGGEILFFIRKR